MKKETSASELLRSLNRAYYRVHKTYERYFWISYMGDHSVDKKRDNAEREREAFRTDQTLLSRVIQAIAHAKGSDRTRLLAWKDFFERHQTQPALAALRTRITALESRIHKCRSSMREGYTDPHTKKFVKLSRNGMYSRMATAEDESVRKACFDALEHLAVEVTDDYVQLVTLRNQYARSLGFSDFYAYKLNLEERMAKGDLFDLWDTVYEKTKYGFENVLKLEKKMPGLRKPWNYGYMLAGSFIKEEDPYFPLERMLPNWINTFSRLGIDYRGGTLVLDLLDRPGKYNNGFCHWPEPVFYQGAKRISGVSQFTCTIVPGIPGQSRQGLHTLFHEGGHGAHLLNADNLDVILNTEYPPASTAWDETQSMFLDTIMGSVEWETRYAKDISGNSYPLGLYLKQIEKLHPTRPLQLMGIMMVCEFERKVYESKMLTKDKVIALAKRVYRKYMNRSVDSVRLLDTPHIYSWESSCSYHGYGLATLALHQWREYFFKKYGYIVDNAAIGKEMKAVWKYGSAKSFPELVQIATGKKLSPNAYLAVVTKSLPQLKKTAHARIERQKAVTQKKLKGNELKATIRLVHGKRLIADSSKGYDAMSQKYAKWIKNQFPAKT